MIVRCFLKCLVLTLIVLVLASACAVAGVPPMISYQGKLVQPSGATVPDGTYQMKFAIYSVATGGTALWSETNSAVQAKSGLFSVLLGSVVNLPSTIFDSPTRWFGVTVGSDPEMSPRQQIASSAFALKSSVSDAVVDAAITNAKLAALAVSTGKLADSSVTASKLGSNSVVTAGLADGAVTAAKIADGTITAAKLAAGVAIPAGTILMWSGAVGSIPTGWALCDGTNGTPNLKDKFIAGAGATYAVGATGGEATHTVSVAEMPAHNHPIQVYIGYYAGPGDGSRGRTDANSPANLWMAYSNNTGGGGAHENRPPYYALCYIMKLAY